VLDCRHLWKSPGTRRHTRCVRRTHHVLHVTHEMCSANTSRSAGDTRDVVAEHTSCILQLSSFDRRLLFSAELRAMEPTMRASVASVLTYFETVRTLTPSVFEPTQDAQSAHLVAILRSPTVDHADASAAMSAVSTTPLFNDHQRSTLLHSIAAIMSGSPLPASSSAPGQQRYWFGSYSTV
jgi:hypothetical protein